MRWVMLPLLLPLFTGGCGTLDGPPLVSAQFPPGTGVVNGASEPQPINSLPPGAANGGTAPGAVQGNGLSRTFRTR